MKTAPKKYQDVLFPSYRKVFFYKMYCHNHSRYIAIGCRRIIFDPGYLAALHRPNMTLRSNDLEAIVEDGIITKAGNDFFWMSWRIFIWCFLAGETLPFDVIVCATGFTIVCLQFEYSPNPTKCWTRNLLTGKFSIRAPWHWSYYPTILWRERRARGLPWNSISSVSQFLHDKR